MFECNHPAKRQPHLIAHSLCTPSNLNPDVPGFSNCPLLFIWLTISRVQNRTPPPGGMVTRGPLLGGGRFAFTTTHLPLLAIPPLCVSPYLSSRVISVTLGALEEQKKLRVQKNFARGGAYVYAGGWFGTRDDLPRAFVSKRAKKAKKA